MSVGRRSLLAVAGALVLCGCGGTSAVPSAKPAPSGIPGVVVTAGLSHDHVAQHVDYSQHPPVGGKHWPPRAGGVLGWQRCGSYTDPVVDEFAVHSLEHGAVWLTYDPAASPQDVSSLRELTGIRKDYVLVSPYPKQPARFMATAWGLQLGADRPDDPRLAEFVRTYAGGGQGDEGGADCAHGSTLAQAKAALAATNK